MGGPATTGIPSAGLSVRRTTRKVVVWTLCTLAAELLALFAYSAQFPWSTAWPVLGCAALTMAAALASGAVVGFLFGLPRTVDEGPVDEGTVGARRRARYRSNTNLEQISDWFTKILVGVGLTQLIVLPHALHSLGEWLKPSLGNTESSVALAIVVVVLNAAGGFLVGYLLTRLCLAGALTRADLDLPTERDELQREIGETEPAADGAESDRSSDPEFTNKVVALDRKVIRLEQAGVLIDADAYQRLARQLKRAGRYREAERAYLKAAVFDPSDPAPLNFAGVLRAKYLADHQGAELLYRRALGIDPDYTSARYNLACNSARQNDRDAALEQLRTAINQNAKYRGLARKDAAAGGPFANLADDDEFRALTGGGQNGGSDETTPG